MKYWKIKKISQYTGFGLNELNKTLGIKCGRNSSKKKIAAEILLLSFDTHYFNLYMGRFLFGLVY